MTTPTVYDHTEFEARWKRDFGHCKTPAEFFEARARITAAEWATITGKSFEEMFAVAMMPHDATGKAQAEALRAMGVKVTTRPGGIGTIDFVVNGQRMFSGWDDATMAKIAKVDWGKK